MAAEIVHFVVCEKSKCGYQSLNQNLVSMCSCHTVWDTGSVAPSQSKSELHANTVFKFPQYRLVTHKSEPKVCHLTL